MSCYKIRDCEENERMQVNAEGGIGSFAARNERCGGHAGRG